MHTSDMHYVNTRDLVGLPNNPRTITQQALNTLCDSIRQNGYWEHRPLAVERQPWTDKLVVLDGNQRLKAMRRLKRPQVPVVEYSDLTDEERNDIILRSNINNGDWHEQILIDDYLPAVDLQAIGLDLDLRPQDLPDVLAPATPTDSEATANGSTDTSDTPDPDAPDDDEPQADRMAFWFRMMGDYRYPTDNEYEIPTLLADNQPVHLELPFAPWGAEARYKKGITTYHFYVDDYRFEQLYKDPIRLLQSGCRAIVEPNNSIHDQTPRAYAIYQIYRKRYLARYLQECGLQVWADLNVSPRFEDINALGIPQGYNAFFTRGVSGWQPTLDRHLQMARRISGLDHPNLIVYGGGKDIEQWCHENGVVYTGEYMNHKFGKKE